MILRDLKLAEEAAWRGLCARYLAVRIGPVATPNSPRSRLQGHRDLQQAEMHREEAAST